MSRSEGALNEGDRNVPQAIIHKRILEAAEERPQASMQELASDIAGASTELVEQVLDEYGVPVPEADGVDATKQHSEIEASDTGPTTTDEFTESTPTLESLSEKQRETLRAIRGRLTATQEELGDMLGGTGAAVSNRLSDVKGFDWEDRADFDDEFRGPSHG